MQRNYNDLPVELKRKIASYVTEDVEDERSLLELFQCSYTRPICIWADQCTVHTRPCPLVEVAVRSFNMPAIEIISSENRSPIVLEAGRFNEFWRIRNLHFPRLRQRHVVDVTLSTQNPVFMMGRDRGSFMPCFYQLRMENLKNWLDCSDYFTFEKQFNQIKRVFDVRNINTLQLKGALWLMIMTEQVEAYSSETDFVERQMNMLVGLYELTLGLIGVLIRSVTTLYECVWSVLDYLSLNWLLAIFDLTVYAVVIYLTYRCGLAIGVIVTALWEAVSDFLGAVRPWFYNTFVLKKNEQRGESYLISVDESEYGKSCKVMVKGEYFNLLMRNDSNRNVLENSLPGSELFPGDFGNFGAICVATETLELSIVGLFFNVDNILITAQHVTATVCAGTADVYLVGVKKGKRKYELNSSKVKLVERDFFDNDTNLHTGSFDIFMKRCDKDLWSAIEVQQVSIKGRSAYNLNITAVGIVDGMVVASNGQTKAGSGPVELWHTATTLKGFSGGPLYHGKHVVGMHIAGRMDHNAAIRIEIILNKMRKESVTLRTSQMPDEEVRRWDPKLRGRSVSFDQLSEDSYVSTDSNGRIDLFDEAEGRRDFPDSLFFKQASKSERMEYEEIHGRQMEDRDEYTGNRSSKRDYNYNDDEFESCPLPTIQEEKEPKYWTLADPERCMHSIASAKDQVEVVAYLDENVEELRKLGYESDKYAYPVMSKQEEKKSLEKHLTLFGERMASITEPVTVNEENRCVNLLLSLFAANKFEPCVGYKTTERLIDIIDSSTIKPSKNSGHPNQDAGLMTNELVLNKYTKLGVAQQVLDMWNDETVLKVFEKYDPTKISKIRNGMPRIITGHALQETIKFVSIFRELTDATVANWKASCIKYPFNPTQPGNIKHLEEWLGAGKLMASDKPAWDYMMSHTLFSILAQVIVGLAQQSVDMEDVEYEEWKKDAYESVMKISTSKKYRCTDGTVFVPKTKGAMSTGCYLTILLNSMSQACIHVLVMMRLGNTDKQILCEENRMVIGGDDVVQRVPENFDEQKYIEVAASMGFTLEQFEFHDNLEGVEFFSHTFSRRDGVWTFEPRRFSKAVMKLRKTKVSELAGALACHMSNYCWNTRKFDFFKRMFMKFRKDHPAEFPLIFMKTIHECRYKALGYE